MITQESIHLLQSLETSKDGEAALGFLVYLAIKHRRRWMHLLETRSIHVAFPGSVLPVQIIDRIKDWLESGLRGTTGWSPLKTQQTAPMRPMQ